jgi:nitrite reductase/ring-hydroxylating ferredoxin subunit
MKKYILLFALLVLAIAGSCGSDDFTNNNKYLPNYSFNIPIDMDLPLYSQLKFINSPVRINNEGAGINGFIVTNTGSGYVAFEASCPNQPLTTCSILSTKQGDIVATCPCDDVKYSLLTGQVMTANDYQYGLKPYKVQQTSATTLVVSN